jgi:uncharacterized protein
MSRACPICRRPIVADYAPFCSRRCADVDLQRWFSGAYAIAAAEADGDDEDASQSEGGRGRTDPL